MWSTLISISLLAALESTTAPATAPSTAPRADTGKPTVVLIVGAEGTPEYGKEFTTWADRWVAAAKSQSASLVQLGREGSSSNPDDRTQLISLIQNQPREGNDPLWIVMIGHGTYDGKDAKFNLRGPDISDTELAEWLRPIRRPLVVIDCASSSGPYLNRLAGKGRVIITATRTGSEVQYSRFGDYMSSAISDSTADLDKDGETSLLEAFLSASHQTLEFYKGASRLATEHALMDDNGDGLGVTAEWFDGLRATRAARDGAPIDGTRAHQMSLVLSPSEQALPQEARVRRDQLEMQVEALRAKKKTLSETQYYAQLEPLLLQLARLYAETSPATQPSTSAH